MNLDEAPNVLIINDVQETPKEMIEDYYHSIQYAISKGQREEVFWLLQTFFEEINRWTVKQVLIDQAKLNMEQLEQMNIDEEAFYEDDDDFDY